MCARYQSASKESHAEHVKRIFRYLADTKELGLWFPKGQSKYLVAYSDSDHAGYKIDRKSTVVNVSFLEERLCLGLAISKLISRYLLLKLSILLPPAVVLKCYGLSNSFKTWESILKKFQSFVTSPVQ